MVPGKGSRRERAAHSQLRSLLRCFSPMCQMRAAALFVRRDFEACAKAFARKSHRNNWPKQT